MKPSAAWTPLRKIAFRFTALFLGLTSIVCLDLIFVFRFKVTDPTAVFKPLVAPFHFLDRFLFHTGYDPTKHESFPQDDHFAVVLYLTCASIAIVLTVLWTLLDRKRKNYERVRYWFNLYIRYLLAATLFGYGAIKLIPVQMTVPGVPTLLTPFGRGSGFWVLWNFMGYSPGYMILTGISEVAASLLLLYKRTIVLGYLLGMVLMINVVAMNIFYNVPVKMFSTQLLVYMGYLLLPYLKTLADYFLLGKSSVLPMAGYRFERPFIQRSMLAVLVIIPLFLNWASLTKAWQLHQGNVQNNANIKFFEVKSFVAKDTIPPNLTDTVRWRHFLFQRHNTQAVVFNMKDEADYYDFDVDSVKQTITLHDNPDTSTWHRFHYRYPTKDEFELTGRWKGQPVQVLLKATSVDSMELRKEKIKWVND